MFFEDHLTLRSWAEFEELEDEIFGKISEYKRAEQDGENRREQHQKAVSNQK